MPVQSPRRRLRRFSAAALLLLCPGLRAAEAVAWPDADSGLPVIQRFPPSVYHAHSEVNDLVIARDGRLYGTTQQALVRFDGTRWETLPFPSLWGRRVDLTDDGRIYVAGNDELGYFADESDGSTVYHSLVSAVPPEALPLGAVRAMRAVGNTVGYGSDKGWLVWADGHFTYTPTPGAARTFIHHVGDALYASATKTGLHRWDGRAWQPLPLPAEFAATAITALGALPGGELLAIAGPNGAFRISADRRAMTPFTGPGGKALADAQAHLLLTLPDGRIAANTRQNGLLLVSADGQSYLQLDRPRGMNDNATFGLALDSAAGLWVGSLNGLARVLIDPGLSTYDERNGISPGALRGFARQGPVLFASVLSSLERLAPGNAATGTPAHFEAVPGAPRAMTDIASHRDGLLFTTNGALHQLGADGTFRKIYTRDEDFYLVSAPENFPERVVIGTERRCIIGELKGSSFTVLYETDATGPIEMVRHLDDGSILLGTRGRGFWHFYPGTDGWHNPRIDVIGEKEGLPPTRSWTAPFRTPLGLRFHTADGTWRFDEAARRFQRDPAFAEDGRDRYAYVGTTDAKNRHWASGGFIKDPFDRRVGWFDFADPTHARWHDAPAMIQGLIGNLGPSFIVIDPAIENRVTLWAKSSNTILRFDGDALAAAPVVPWRPSLRRVFANGSRHSLTPTASPRFAYATEPIVFDFSSNQLDGTPVTFQTRLVGFDDRWSDIASPTVAFTNLSGGPFTLEFRARDLTGRVSETGRFTFAVAPPWYRSPVAFVLYLLAALGAVAGYVRWRLGRAAREQRRLEAIVAERTRDLATARDQAEAASRAKSAFLAAMSHELRTPLNGVIGYAQVLQDDRRLLSDQRERLRIVQNSGEHLLRMINDVLDLAKIEAGKLELRPAPFALADLIRDIAAAHAPAAAAKRLTFTTDLATNLPAWVEGDAQKLRQVLDNLLGNAVKFTATGTVTLQVSAASGSQLSAPNSQLLSFAVIDTGAGIDAADQARLFQPFEQATRSRPNAPGAGLGLAISRALVERLGGTLTLASAPGRGSTFAFAVPLPAIAAAPSLTPAGRRLSGFHGPARHVLIVDDHAVNRSLLTDLLVPLGFTCIEFPSGESSLAHLAQPGITWPDLAILDVRMEGLDGLELTRRLRALPRGGELKILLTSASVLTFDPAEGRRAGCDDFLPKPFRTADLVEKIGALLGLRWREADSRAPFPAGATTPLPPAVRDQLREYLAEGDLDAFRAALTALRPLHPAAETRFIELETAAAGFELSRLRRLLDEP